MEPRIWYADQIAHLVTRGPSEASRQFVALADYHKLQEVLRRCERKAIGSDAQGNIDNAVSVALKYPASGGTEHA